MGLAAIAFFQRTFGETSLAMQLDNAKVVAAVAEMSVALSTGGFVIHFVINFMFFN